MINLSNANNKYNIYKKIRIELVYKASVLTSAPAAADISLIIREISFYNFVIQRRTMLTLHDYVTS